MGFGWLLSLLTGLPGFLDKLVDHLNKRVDAGVQNNTTNVAADKEINLAVIQGRIEERKIAAEARAADRGSMWTAWMMPFGFAFPAAAHYWSITFDSMTWFGHTVGSWGIAALPEPYKTYEGQIILAVIGVVGAKAIIGKLFSR